MHVCHCIEREYIQDKWRRDSFRILICKKLFYLTSQRWVRTPEIAQIT